MYNLRFQLTRWLAIVFLLPLLIACGGGGGGGDGGGGAPPVTVVPAKVQSLRVTPGDGQATLSWRTATLADSYNIYYSTTINAGTSGTLIENVSPGYVRTGLTNGTNYFYVVTAVNVIGEGEASDEDRATPSASILLSSLVFPDSNLAQCVSDVAANYGHTYVYELTSLICDYKNISDITGIDALTSLKRLRLNGNTFTDISPLPGMYWLASLDIPGYGASVPASFAPIAGMTNLVSVDFSNHNNNFNNFSDLSGLVNLRSVKIGFNGVTDISFLTNMTDITTLDLSFNTAISNLSLIYSFTNMENLSLWNTGLTDIGQLISFPNLITINVSMNTISDASVLASFPDLKDVNVGDNNISNISFIENLDKLTFLNIRDNNITDVSLLSAKPDIVWLYMNGNNISDISALADLTEMRILFLGDNNNITDFSVVSGMYSLRTFEATNSGLNNIDFLAGKNFLYQLSLDGNNITSAAPFAAFTSLVNLQLNNNNLGGAGVGDIDQLTSLTNAASIQLDGNLGMSCAELTTLINALGSPPVDTDQDSATADVAVNGVNCTN